MITIKNLRYEAINKTYQVRVDRASVLGNPFIMSSECDRDAVCNKYEAYFHKKLKEQQDTKFCEEVLRLVTLLGRYGQLELFCWCAPKRCHAETIKRFIEEVLYKTCKTKPCNTKQKAD